MTVLYLILTALCAYFLGSMNGAIITARYVFHKDVRRYGSGNAGLTNFLRSFGLAGAALVVLIDALKSVAAVAIGGALLGIVDAAVTGKLFAGFCLILGHIYPAFYRFKGGKGVLCGGVMAFMVDWRVGLCCIVAFLVIVIFTRYVSLGSMIASILCSVFMSIFGYGWLEATLALLCGLVIVVKHAENIMRLIGGTERKISIGGSSTPRQGGRR